jgi:cell division protein FtsZ
MPSGEDYMPDYKSMIAQGPGSLFTGRSKLRVVGIGSEGLTYLEQILDIGLEDTELIVAHSDAETLERSRVPQKVLLEPSFRSTLTSGAAGFRDCIDASSRTHLAERLSGAEAVFVVSGFANPADAPISRAAANIASETGAGLVLATIGLTSTGGGLWEGDRTPDEGVVSGEAEPYDQLHSDPAFLGPYYIAGARVADAVHALAEIRSGLGDEALDLSAALSTLEGGTGTRNQIVVTRGHGQGPESIQESVLGAFEDPILKNRDTPEGIVLHIRSAKDAGPGEIREAKDIVSRWAPNSPVRFITTIDPSLWDQTNTTVLAALPGKPIIRIPRKGHRQV